MTMRGLVVLLGASLASAAPARVAELVGMKHTSENILEQCDVSQYDAAEPKHFSGDTLGFITPWHAEAGKATARKFAKKFTHISPMWYHIVLTEAGPDVAKWKVEVEPASNEEHAAPDADFVRAMHEDGVKVVPVFAFYGWTRDSMGNFMLNKKSGTPAHHLSRAMMKACKEVDCDGLMIEWGPVPVKEYYEPCKAFLTRLRGGFQKFFKEPKELMLSVHPDITIFDKETAAALLPTVSRFALHMYNFTGPMLREGPNAPISFFQDIMKAWKLKSTVNSVFPQNAVFGVLPFFGREYRLDGPGLVVEDYEGVDPRKDEDGNAFRWDVTGDAYADILRGQEVTHGWNHDFKEHYLEYTKDGSPRKVYYPSVKTLKKRIALLDEAPVAGLGVWNLGTGQDYLYDLI